MTVPIACFLIGGTTSNVVAVFNDKIRVIS